MLKNAMLNTQNYTLTENGALTHRSTKSHVLDLFALGAAVREYQNKQMLENLIANALDEDLVKALKVIFYLSDIREGQGSRDFFKTALRQVMLKDVKLARKLLPYVAQFGRWDYLYWFVGTSLQNDAFALFEKELVKSFETNRPSLIFKWLASEDAASQETQRNARLTCKYLKLEPKEYRQMLSKGRKMLGEAVVERKMTEGEWQEIDYSRVGSMASRKYRKAFVRHAPENFRTFVTKVKSGEVKMNAKVIYPYQILQSGLRAHGLERDAAQAQWQSLPNYIPEGSEAIFVVDTSGSMSWGGIDPQPRLIANSLGIYAAERLAGEFKNCYITFSREARLVQLPNGNVFDKYKYLERNSINENTNLQSVFDLVLRTALQNRIPQGNMPKRIVIVSDMEFDNAVTGFTNLEVIRAKYRASGYEMPMLVFWNVAARHNQTPATLDSQGIALISGFSPSIMKAVLSANPVITPYDMMLEVINVQRYAFLDTL